ncbi:MAG: family 20 glycosylhydrolase [Clostridia bacterium]|nr:family 20 glycosylhydrolase [Clostridia bacterium]
MKKRFGVMLDMSRNAVMKPDEVKKFADTIKKLGYNMIHLYTEDTYEVPGEPYFGYLRGRYSQAELKDIVAYCDSIDVEVIPCIQTLAHLNQLFYWKPYAAINDTDDILMVGDERTYQLIENMLKSVKECFTSNVVNIGIDEAHMVGLGKYLDKNGFENRFSIIRRHLDRVLELTKKYDLKPIMWSDMFFRLGNKGTYFTNDRSVITDEIVAACPEGVEQVYWDYYTQTKDRYDAMLDMHERFPGKTWFAGGAWTWVSYASNNAFSIKTMSLAAQSCKEHGVDNVMMTMWGDNGKLCSFYTVLPSLYAIRRIYDGVTDMDVIKKEFGEITGEDFDAMMLFDIPVDFGNLKLDHTYPHMYMLYSDPFLGAVDASIKKSYKNEYLAIADKLAAAAKTSQYKYLFENAETLCRALALKHDLGVRTRAAYKAGDREALAAIADDYTATIKAVETFEAAFRKMWLTENKPNGLEVCELRHGGLLLRLKNCRDRLLAYLAGDKTAVAELDEELLPYRGHGYLSDEFDMPRIPRWWHVASPNRIV